MKRIILWDMTPYSPLSCTRSFGGTYRLHLQGRRISSANHRVIRWHPEDDTLQIYFCLDILSERSTEINTGNLEFDETNFRQLLHKTILTYFFMTVSRFSD
jgi:hypothetical protein